MTRHDKYPYAYLNFPDEATAKATLYKEDGSHIDGLITVAERGVLQHPTGEFTTDSDGIDVPVMADSDEWSVDVQMEYDTTLPVILEPYHIPEPVNPKFKFC